jgi:hypothetical protein
MKTFTFFIFLIAAVCVVLALSVRADVASGDGTTVQPEAGWTRSVRHVPSGADRRSKEVSTTMSNHSTRMSRKALAAVMAGAGLALAACGSTAAKSSLPVSKAPSNSIGHNSGSPSSFSLAQLQSLAPFDQANQLPIYNGDNTQLDPSWQDPQIPLPNSHIGVPTVLRVPKPEVLKAWVEDTAVPYVGPIYVGTGLTPLERDAAYTAVTFNAWGGRSVPHPPSRRSTARSWCARRWRRSISRTPTTARCPHRDSSRACSRPARRGHVQITQAHSSAG